MKSTQRSSAGITSGSTGFTPVCRHCDESVTVLFFMPVSAAANVHYSPIWPAKANY
jgi:hypothetical protein